MKPLRQVDMGQFLEILGAPSPDGYHPASWSENIDDPDSPRVLHSMSEFWVSDETPPTLVAKGYSGKLWVEYSKAGSAEGLDAPTMAQEASLAAYRRAGAMESGDPALYLNKPSPMNAKTLIDSAIDETSAGSSYRGSSKMGSSAGSSSGGSKKKNLPPWLRKKGGSSKSESEASGTSAHVVAGSAAGSSHTDGSMVADEPTSKNVNLKSTHAKGGDGKVPSAIKMAKTGMPTPIGKEFTTSSNESESRPPPAIPRKRSAFADKWVSDRTAFANKARSEQDSEEARERVHGPRKMAHGAIYRESLTNATKLVDRMLAE